VNGTLFFTADDGVHGRELWKSDGTAAGTALVKDIYPGTTNETFHGYYGHGHIKVINSSNPGNLVNVNGTLYFGANDGTHGTELWKSDGTSNGTVLVADIQPGSGSSSPADLTAMSGTLFFRANDGSHGWELWKSDGTATGTVLVKDINPGSSSPNYSGSLPSDLTGAGGTLFFEANDGIHGRELWESDGTAAGTVLVKDINPGIGNSDPESLTVAGGHLFFSANDGVHGIELWDPPIGPTSGTDAVATPGGLSGHRVSLPPGAPGGEGAEVVAVLPPSDRQGPVDTCPLAPHPTGLGSARAAQARLRAVLDQVLGEVAPRPRLTRSGSALDRLRDPDVLEDLALGRQLG
jgi:ELWxxDGT repeat protein